MLQNVSRGPTVSTAQNRALDDRHEEEFPSAHARATRILTSSREMAAAGNYSQEWKDARKGARRERRKESTQGLSQDDLGKSQDAPDRSAADATDAHSKSQQSRRQRRTLSGAAGAAAAAGKRGARSKETQVQSKLWMQSFQMGSQPRGVDFYRQSH